MNNTELANPAPLGLAAFGMTTILLNLHNAGFFAMDDIILSMGIFYGGIAQILAGILEYKKGNTFGLTAFASYGSFWLTLVAVLLMPKMGLADAPDPGFLGSYLGLWGVFTLLMFFGTLKSARMLQFVFLSLTVLFILLSVGNIISSVSVIHIAGWTGLVCGVSAVYLAMGEVLNGQFGRTVLPVGEPRTQ
ncbi:TPA: acetate uptake transporter [Salmonella enterica subsp. enterica serovar Muenchen]|nr:acetate uptake transporter [Salmonella enterica]HDD2123873.1 acetate uptake transporter [Salmonella enterica]